MEGYGIFWVLIETLRDQPEYKYPLALIPALARRYNTTTEKVKTVVMQYGFFEIENDEFFYSESLNRRMKSLSKFRESQRQKALKRWSDAPALPRESNGNADPIPVKESKVKESKVNIPPISPTGMDVRFAKFWEAYPRKIGKGAAEKAFKKYRPDDDLLATMLSNLSAQKRSEQWTKDGGQFIPYPATWLNQRRWEDVPEKKESGWKPL
nr:MAG TPA: replisome organizer [Caudoviricetes sp.]